MSKLLEYKNLTKQYGNRKALNDITMSFNPGQIIGLLGPNGSGKSTLIKLTEGLIKPTSGEILIDGMAPSAETKAIISYLPDRNSLPDHMKAAQVIDLYKTFFDDFDVEKSEAMLVDLNLDREMKIKEMSKGTVEKLQLILTMSRNARIYLLDEPIAGVDPAARDYILRTIINNYSPGAIVIISTHLIADIENVLDSIIFIKDGSLVMHGQADEIRAEKGMGIDELFREVFKC